MSKIELSSTPSFSGSGLQSRTGTRLPPALGLLAGQQVEVDDDEADAMLSDAVEEIGMYQAEKTEFKHFSERQKEASAAPELMSEEEILAYGDAAQAFDDPELLARLARSMLSGQGDPAQQARQAFDEPSSQHMALQYALQQGQREGAPSDVLEALRDALQDLELAHGPAIRADINTVGTAAQEGASRAEIARFQTTYRDVVLGESSLAATLKLALERFGDQDFSAGLQRLTRALGQDLSAARPSCNPVRLRSLVQDLYQLEVAATVLEGCKKLQGVLAERHGVASLSPVMLMRGLVDASAEKYVTAQRFASLSESCGALGSGAQIHFLTTVKALLRQMPVQVFADPEQRQSVFGAVQDALDAAIDQEAE